MVIIAVKPYMIEEVITPIKKELQEKIEEMVLDKLHQFLVDTMQWTEIITGTE